MCPRGKWPVSAAQVVVYIIQIGLVRTHFGYTILVLAFDNIHGLDLVYVDLVYRCL